MNVCLAKYQWHNNNNVWVTGYIRYGERYLKNDEFLSVFTGITTIQEFEEALLNANGQFSIIIKTNDEIWAATDRLRNWPLYYSNINGEFIISDDSYILCELQPEKLFNQAAVDSFQTAGFVVNNLTLINNIFQIEAGEYIILGESFSRRFYYESYTAPTIEKDFITAGDDLYNIIDDVFKNHLKALSDKSIAIPLSGGFDSRLIAAMCSKYHPENVICYTYGIKNNPESPLAQEAAKRLGLRWINIEYNTELISGYFSDEIFRNYYPYASGLSGMFFFQEYFAVKYLKDNRLIPDNCVFIPGFSGDMLAGGHLIPAMARQIIGKNITRMIFREFFGLISTSGGAKLNLAKLISAKIPQLKYDTWKIFENWDQKERQAKFIVNSAKVFRFFGYDYVLPFWDNCLMDHFSNLPFHLKLNKKLYDHVLMEHFFKTSDLNLPNEINPVPIQKSIQRVKEKIKPFLPYHIKDLFLEHKSMFLYDEITKVMVDEMGAKLIIRPKESNNYNSYIAQWYLYKTRNMFNIK